MNNFSSEETISALTKLGLYQVAGGLIGFLLIGWTMINGGSINFSMILLFTIVFLFFGYSVYAGWLCLKINKKAFRHSMINQIMQVIGFAILGFGFQYAAGLYLTIGIDLTDSIQLGFGAGISKVDININRHYERLEVNLNLIAFALIYWIDKNWRKAKEEALLQNFS
ncbi:hypothetical protein L0U88_09850 [Flavihumibacter sp. RY-1]|uniref:Uncharacterized protein n=1 Tax=Flavihumibacter fluminis TaxID=2909236 RepID=A0ABS9BGV8_9BACT|nr:hypothetical protein [Flavihumibacter fluminis]MCF1714928.1 hypothetical protein [Flavihumibacter fluminis]